ncbi:MlaD family protein [Mucilaginibacter sp.]|uniref:MlaD family protein n=1 Tax=Mucilaginibacter sp. TaxID=1882438 RepID=UPI00261762B7|nr:MlaD family protein [Mucilaginibacter sp.]MDB5032393.1 transporter permease [Mucilaginibacter sp.]
MNISNETKIGALTTIAIAVLILGYSFLKGNDLFSGSNKFYAIYKSVDGLSVSKPVLVNGFPIGHVSGMQLDQDGRTTVEFKIKSEYKIPVNTLAKLVSTDLLGGKAIVFELGDSKELAENRDTLRADIQGSLAESLQPIQTKAENLITKLDSSLASINKILNPNFQRNVDRSFTSIANSLQTLEGTTKKIDNLVAAQTGHINGILSNAEDVSSNLKNTSAGLTGITSNLQRFSGDLANSNIRQTLDNANKAVADLQATMANINSNKGSMGLLLNDDKLYKNLQAASDNLNLLFLDLKANPKRYVHFSVFGGGKKDK